MPHDRNANDWVMNRASLKEKLILVGFTTELMGLGKGYDMNQSLTFIKCPYLYLNWMTRHFHRLRIYMCV